MYVRYYRRAAIPSGPRQFSLRSLMVFVAVCAMYFSQFTPSVLGFSIGATPWRTAVTVALTWIILAVFYWWHRLFGMFLIHCLAPGLIAALLIGNDPGSRAGWYGLAMVVILAAVLVNMLCFPVAVIVMAARWLRQPPATEETENHTAGKVSGGLPEGPGQAVCQSGTSDNKSG
jgi:hypothetical protein